MFTSQGMSSVWTHDGDPIAYMQTNKLLERFNKDFKENPKMLQERVKKYLKVNSHSLQFNFIKNLMKIFNVRSQEYDLILSQSLFPTVRHLKKRKSC